MRPDRIVLGEVRGGEALDMLQAMNTGHDGSLTTIHSNNPRDAVSRLETLSLMAELNLPDKAIRQQIASAVSIIVQVARLSDGTRRVTHISEVIGFAEDRVTMQDIVVFDRLGIGAEGRVLGRFRATGLRPTFAERLKMSGVHLPPNIFEHVCEV
jgi:pilus assembly protein CpaF